MNNPAKTPLYHSTFQYLINVAQQIAQVIPAIQHIQHLVAHGQTILVQNGFALLSAVHQHVPLVPCGVQFLHHAVMLGLQLLFRIFQFALESTVALAHLLVHPHLFELHVQLKDFFQQIGRDDLLLQLSGASRLFGCRLGLFFQLHALQPEQVFSPRNRVLQRAVRVVQVRTLFQGPLLFAIALDGVDVGMQVTAQIVELALQPAGLQVQFVGQSKKSEVVHRHGRLHFATLLTEVRGAHGSAGPAVDLGWAALTDNQNAAILRVLVLGVRHQICAAPMGINRSFRLPTPGSRPGLTQNAAAFAAGFSRPRKACRMNATFANGGFAAYRWPGQDEIPPAFHASWTGSLRERSAAATRLLRVRVLEHEALVHQGLFVIQDHAVQINERLRIDEDANVVELKDTIAFARLRVETDVVTQSRTTTTLHSQAKAALGGRDMFFRQGRTNASDRLLRHLNTLGGGGGSVGRILDVNRAHSPVPAYRTERRGTPVLSNSLCPLFNRSALRLRLGLGHAVLLLPVTNRSANGVFRQHRTVDLHRGQRQFLHDVGVPDG